MPELRNFNKDPWILDALKAGHIVVDHDTGKIYRQDTRKRRSSTTLPYRKINFSTHKKSGRIYFQLRWKGITKSVLVNRVVALALIPNPNNMPEVNHIDGDKTNNHPSNLEWSSRHHNERHAADNGLKANRGTSNSNSKLKPHDITKIRQSKMTDADLARLYQVSPKTIADVRSGKTWSHI